MINTSLTAFSAGDEPESCHEARTRTVLKQVAAALSYMYTRTDLTDQLHACVELVCDIDLRGALLFGPPGVILANES